MSSVRDWSDQYDGTRHKVLKRSISVALIAAEFDSWFTVEEAFERYRDQVGNTCSRTIYRYLLALVEVGMLEMTKAGYIGDGSRFRWLGWPATGRQAKAMR